MLRCGESDAVRSKMFASTLSEKTLDWFNNLPKHNITSFDVFSQLFIIHFAANKPKVVKVFNLFDIKQEKDESLEKFLRHFCELMMHIA